MTTAAVAPPLRPLEELVLADDDDVGVLATGPGEGGTTVSAEPPGVDFRDTLPGTNGADAGIVVAPPVPADTCTPALEDRGRTYAGKTRKQQHVATRHTIQKK